MLKCRDAIASKKIALLWCEAQKECQKGFSHLGGCLVTGEEKGGVERR